MFIAFTLLAFAVVCGVCYFRPRHWPLVCWASFVNFLLFFIIYFTFSGSQEGWHYINTYRALGVITFVTIPLAWYDSRATWSYKALLFVLLYQALIDYTSIGKPYAYDIQNALGLLATLAEVAVVYFGGRHVPWFINGSDHNRGAGDNCGGCWVVNNNKAHRKCPKG